MAGKKIRWGMLGAGAILDRWMKGAVQVEGAEVAAVASRTVETAGRQAEKFGIPSALTYDEILKRKDIDIMYIPVPHTAHKELAIRAMNAGFPVLVEKPAGVTAADWKEMTTCISCRCSLAGHLQQWCLSPPLIRMSFTCRSTSNAQLSAGTKRESLLSPMPRSGRIYRIQPGSTEQKDISGSRISGSLARWKSSVRTRQRRYPCPFPGTSRESWMKAISSKSAPAGDS